MEKTATPTRADTSPKAASRPAGQKRTPPRTVPALSPPAPDQWPLLGAQFAYAYTFPDLRLTHLSDNFWRLTGHRPHAVELPFLNDLIHPDDCPAVLRASLLLAEFVLAHPELLQPLEHVFSIDFRLRRANGTYLRVLRQTCVLTKAPDGAIASCISVCSDITEQKKSTDIHFGMNLPEFTAYLDRLGQGPLPAHLSHREEEILKLLIEGKSSRAIATMLHLSIYTVDTHRKNMKKKLNMHNNAELVCFGLAHGL